MANLARMLRNATLLHQFVTSGTRCLFFCPIMTSHTTESHRDIVHGLLKTDVAALFAAGQTVAGAASRQVLVVTRTTGIGHFFVGCVIEGNGAQLTRIEFAIRRVDQNEIRLVSGDAFTVTPRRDFFGAVTSGTRRGQLVFTVTSDAGSVGGVFDGRHLIGSFGAVAFMAPAFLALDVGQGLGFGVIDMVAIRAFIGFHVRFVLRRHELRRVPQGIPLGLARVTFTTRHRTGLLPCLRRVAMAANAIIVIAIDQSLLVRLFGPKVLERELALPNGSMTTATDVIQA